MKIIIQKILTLWTLSRAVFSQIRVTASHGLCFLVRWENRGTGNEISCPGGRLSNARVIFKGNGNRIIAYGSVTYATFQIEGCDNVFEIAENGKIKKGTFVLRGNHCRISIGEGSEIFEMTAVCQGQQNEITVGRDCLFSTQINLWASDTHTIYDENGSVCNHSRPIHVGDHVWLGKEVSVLKGCSIGAGSVVGMHSLVSGDLPGAVVAAGNPAKVIRKNIRWDKAFVDQEGSFDA